MKTINNYIVENVKEAHKNEWYDVYTIAQVKMPGKKRKTSIACYNLGKLKEDTKLDYDDQIIFKYYCFYKWGVKYEKYDGLHENWIPVNTFEDTKNKFYFDDVDCVDGNTDKNIPNVRCDGSLTFKEARELLEEYFNI